MNNTESWEVNKILNFRVKNAQLKYLIKWTKFEKNNWKKFANVIDASKIINVYHTWNLERLSKNSWITYTQRQIESKYKD